MSIDDEVCELCGSAPLARPGGSRTFSGGREENASPWICSNSACPNSKPRNANGDFTIAQKQWDAEHPDRY